MEGFDEGKKKKVLYSFNYGTHLQDHSEMQDGEGRTCEI